MKRLLISTALLPCLLQTFAQFSGLGSKAKSIPCNKRSFLTFLFSLCFTFLFAGPVTQQQAFEKAQRFMKSKKIKDGPKTNRAQGKDASQKNEPFYVFNAEEGGFVIVSGDDRTEEILGYSNTGNIDFENIPDNMSALFEIYRKEINSLANKSKSNSVVRPNRNAVAPIIKAQWNQGDPYNLLCPEISGRHALSGCAPTAIAQVLYHYKWPITENPPLDGYGFVSEFPATTFNWGEMRSDYKNGNYSESEGLAVAELMRYVGQKLQVDYGLDGTALWFDWFSSWLTTKNSSGNKVIPLFKDFGYSPNMAGILRRYTTRSYWEDVIYNEVYEGRPVLIGADGADGAVAHEFICDGYDGRGYFHINWGWEGVNDGYYLLTTIDLYEQNIINSGNHIFTENQTAYIGIRPSKEDDIYNYKILEGQGWSSVKNYYRNTTSHIFENVTFNMFFINFSDFLFDGDLGVGLFKDGCDISNIERILSTEPISINSFDVVEKKYYMDFDADIPNGSYMLLPICKKKDDNEWRIASPNYYYLDISDEVLSIYQTTIEWPNSQLVINDVLFNDILVKGEPCTIQIDFTNKNNDNCNRVWIYENDEVVQDFDDLIADFGQRNSQNIRYTPKKEGKIKFSLRGPSSSEIYFEKIIDIYSDNQLAVDNVTAYIDNTASIGINLENNTTDLTAYQFDLKLPTGFTLAKDSKNIYQVTKTSRYEDDSQQLTVSLQEDGSYRFISSSMSNGVIDGTSGAILNAVMEVADNVIVGNYEGTISNIIFTKADGTQVKLIDTKFIIMVDKIIMGNANGDSEVNVADIVEIVNYILDKPSAKFVKTAADLNKDGDVNVTDIVMVVNIIMSSQSSVRQRSEKIELSTDNDLLTLTEVGNGRLSLSLENRGDYVASQFDVRLSEGQTLESITLNGHRSGSHLLNYAKTGDNMYKVIVYSLSNETFIGNSGELIDFKVTGSGNVIIENIVFVTAGHQEKWFAPLSNRTTGIEDNSTWSDDDCYDLQGRRVVNVGQKGVYIMNGKKYVVK